MNLILLEDLLQVLEQVGFFFFILLYYYFIVLIIIQIYLISGITSATFTYPLDLVRTRLSVHSNSNIFIKLFIFQNFNFNFWLLTLFLFFIFWKNKENRYKGIGDAIVSVYKNEGGIRALYRGLPPTLLVYFFFFFIELSLNV